MITIIRITIIMRVIDGLTQATNMSSAAAAPGVA